MRKLMSTLCIGFVVLLNQYACISKAAVEKPSYEGYVGFEYAEGAFPLVAGGKAASLYVDSADYSGVRKVVELFQDDVRKVTGIRPVLAYSVPAGGMPVIIGTVGKSAIVNDLVSRGKLNIENLEGRWEKSIIEVVEQPWPGVEKALVIAGSDKRGTIFGMFDISRKMGVSPWYWWADVPVTSHDQVYIAGGHHDLGEPRVKYRGIFLNDEEPALGRWAVENYGGFNHSFYEKVFELLLRQKANFLWPAMWWASFSSDDPLNAQLADEMGIVISTSHHEPMMRAHAEWKPYEGGEWNYKSNAGTLKQFWKEGIERMGSNESIVTLAMRGDGDEAMEEGTNIALLEQIVKDQRAILEEVTRKPADQTPQVWALYKEVQDYYNKGMEVPDDVTLLLCDDNWGNVRVLPEPGAPVRKGGYGMYYHFDFVGGPRSYKWLNTVQVSRIWEQMQLTYAHGVDRIWIVNVGDLKPMELPISFFLDYAWNPEAMAMDGMQSYTRNWAAEQFGPAHAKAISYLLDRYTQYNSRRKPESLGPESYSLHNYNEFERVVSDYNQLFHMADSIDKLIDPSQKDAYYQLVYFPIAVCANLNELYYSVALNRYYASQGLAQANTMAQKARELFERDAQLTHDYHTKPANGKWNHMMAQPHIGYTSWQQPDKNSLPRLEKVINAKKGDIHKIIEVTETVSPEGVEGFVENRGVVSMEAMHPHSTHDGEGYRWQMVDGLGRTKGAAMVQPRTGKILSPGKGSPCLEYVFTLVEDPQNDSITVKTILLPTLNYSGGEGLRFALSIDDGDPLIINMHEGCDTPDWEYPQWWNDAVMNNAFVTTTKIGIQGKGRHVLRYWMLDPGVVLQKLVLDNGGLRPSYLGPPESKRAKLYR